MGLLKRQTGKFITSPMVGVLLGSHFYGCIEGLSGSVALGRVGGTGGVALVHIVTFGKIRWAIMSFGSFKSPRGERIRPVCLHPESTPDFMQAFRASIALSHIPHS